MKRASILILSVLLLYGGVAWALDACLQRNNHSHHATSEHHLDFHHVSSEDSTDSAVPIFHCTSANEQVGPGMRVTSAEIPRYDKGVALHASPVSEALAPAFRNDLWLEALFKRTVTFSLPIDLAHHLFLSVLQI